MSQLKRDDMPTELVTLRCPMCGTACDNAAPECDHCGEPLRPAAVGARELSLIQVLSVGLSIIGALTMAFVLIGGVVQLLL